MKRIRLVQVTLFIFSVIAVSIGLALLLMPVTFEASAGIMLDGNGSLLSELRAFGGFLIAGGIVIFLGVLKVNLIQSSLKTSTVLYLSVGFSRVVGMLFDGMPSSPLISATIIELAIGLISIFILLSVKRMEMTFG